MNEHAAFTKLCQTKMSPISNCTTTDNPRVDTIGYNKN